MYGVIGVSERRLPAWHCDFQPQLAIVTGYRDDSAGQTIHTSSESPMLPFSYIGP